MMDNIYITYCSALQISGRQPVNYGTGARRTAGAAAAFLSDIIEVNVYSFPPFVSKGCLFLEVSSASCVSQQIPYFAQVMFIILRSR